MAIELLTVCEWSGPRVQNCEILHPTWDQVEDAIRSLDEKAHNDLYLQPNPSNPDTYLAVGGGAGRYLVSGSIDCERFPAVVNEGETDRVREMLIVGGQAGDYPRNWIVDLDTALRAARTLFETGEFSGGGLRWVDV